MKIKTTFLLIILLSFFKGFSQEKQPKTVQFVGSINKTVYGIITLDLNSEKYQNGLFLNLITGENIPLAGTFQDGILKLKEYQFNQEMSGYFEGELQENYVFGVWIAPNRKKEVPFVFKITTNLYEDITDLNLQLSKQTKSIENAINKKEWNTFISYCDKEQYSMQTQEIGLSKTQYIGENLSILISKAIREKLHLNKKPYSQIEEEVINGMTDFKINKVEVDTIYFNFLKYSGTFNFKGIAIPFSFFLNKNYKITGGVG